MKAILLADGGAGVGLGHLTRCGAVADALASRGFDCLFVTADESVAHRLRAAGRDVRHLPSRAGASLPDGDFHCDLFILDSYRVPSQEVAATVRPAARLIAAFDDHLNRHDVADVIISTGVHSPSLPWPKRPGLTHLLGPSYHPLRSDFLPLASRGISETVRRVVVTLGGSGDPAILKTIVEALANIAPSAEIQVVQGPFAEKTALQDRPGISLVQAPISLKPIFLAGDIAVSASGQTLLELAAVGTPTIAVGLADNQRDNLAGLERAGVVVSAGCAREDGFPARLVAAWRRLQPPAARRELSEQGQKLIDGRGAGRLAEAISVLLKKRGAATP